MSVAMTYPEAARIWREALSKAERVYVYAIQAGDDGPVKIGLAKCPAERRATLQCGNHLDLRGLAAWRDLPCEEKLIHEEFAHARIRGEWFEPVPELIEYVLQRGDGWLDWDWAQLKKDRATLEAGGELEVL